MKLTKKQLKLQLVQSSLIHITKLLKKDKKIPVNSTIINDKLIVIRIPVSEMYPLYDTTITNIINSMHVKCVFITPGYNTPTEPDTLNINIMF